MNKGDLVYHRNLGVCEFEGLKGKRSSPEVVYDDIYVRASVRPLFFNYPDPYSVVPEHLRPANDEDIVKAMQDIVCNHKVGEITVSLDEESLTISGDVDEFIYLTKEQAKQLKELLNREIE